jgi:hypothetical protein
MNFSGTHTTVSRKALVVIAAAGLALAAVGSASAEPNKTPPAKKGCSIEFKGPGAGQSIEYPDGYSMSVNATDGKKHTYTCNDGTWKETVALTAGPATWRGSVSIVDGTSNTLQVALR